MSAVFGELCRTEFRKHFDRYDSDKIQRIQLKDLPQLVRICGAAPLEADLDSLKAVADQDGRGSCDFEGFCRAMKMALDSSVSEEDARRAFRGFDPDRRGLITPHELRYYLSSMGDALTPEEMNLLVEELRGEMDMEGNLVVNDVVAKLTPEMYR